MVTLVGLDVDVEPEEVVQFGVIGVDICLSRLWQTRVFGHVLRVYVHIEGRVDVRVVGGGLAVGVQVPPTARLEAGRDLGRALAGDWAAVGLVLIGRLLNGFLKGVEQCLRLTAFERVNACGRDTCIMVILVELTWPGLTSAAALEGEEL